MESQSHITRLSQKGDRVGNCILTYKRCSQNNPGNQNALDLSGGGKNSFSFNFHSWNWSKDIHVFLYTCIQRPIVHRLEQPHMTSCAHLSHSQSVHTCTLNHTITKSNVHAFQSSPWHKGKIAANAAAVSRSHFLLEDGPLQASTTGHLVLAIRHRKNQFWPHSHCPHPSEPDQGRERMALSFLG